MTAMALTGAAPLLRVSIRHDGPRGFAPWIIAATALSVSSVLVYPWIFPEEQDRLALEAAVGSNPALSLILGPAFDLSTTDGFNAWRSLALAGFFTALGAIFAVVRATRGQEDSGQAELLASGVLGRESRLFAGVGLALIGSILVGVISGTVTALFGGGWETSLLLGATFTASGWMFAAIAAVAAQLGSDARTATSLSVGILGALFVLRGFSYAVDAPEWTIWANPLGWMTETRPASGDYWWPLLLALAFTVVVLGIAFALQTRRDFGQGLIASRPGPARGRLRSSWGLAVRLNSGSTIVWIIAFLALGTVFGYFATSIRDILEENAAVAQILAAGATTPDGLISAFLVTIFSLIGIIAAIPGVQTILKVRSEEQNDRVEPVLAAAVSRPRYLSSNILLSFASSTLYVLLAGLIVAAMASGADIGVSFGDALLQAVVTIPAVWTIVAVSVAVVGARPQVSPAAWLGVVAAFALTILGPTFQLWDEVLAISPFWHVPDVTDTSADWSGLGWISLVTALFLVIGLAGFRRRDLAR